MDIRSIDTRQVANDVSLIQVIINSSRLFVFITSFCFIVGIVLALFLSEKYEYSILLEIGSIPSTQIGQDGTVRLLSTQIESPETTVAKCVEVYAPSIQNSKKEFQKKNLYFEAENPRNSSLVKLSVRGTLTDEASLISMLSEISYQVLENHRVLFDGEIEKLKVRLTNAEEIMGEYNVSEKELNSKVLNMKEGSDMLTLELRTLAREAQNSRLQAMAIRESIDSVKTHETKIVGSPLRSIRHVGISPLLFLPMMSVIGIAIAFLACVFREGYKTRIMIKADF